MTEQSGDPGSASAVRTFQVRGRTWSEKETALHRKKGYGGFAYFPFGPKSEVTADFVRDLPDLRYVAVGGNMGDDSAIFELDSLEALFLDYTSRRPADLSRVAQSVQRIHFGWRPDFRMPTSPQLTKAFFSRWAAKDLSFLEEQPQLQELKIELKRKHTMSALGGPRLPRLTELEFLLGTVADLADAEFPPSLERIIFHGVSDVDLGFVRRLPALQWLDLEKCTVRSLKPLDDCPSPSLRGVSHYKAVVADGDMSPLDRFKKDA